MVRENVASFGGNPDQVRESAGASSVELHLVSKNVEVLFYGAIARSVFRSPLPAVEQQEVNSHFLLMNVVLLIDYNSCFSTSIQVMPDAGQDPSRFNWNAYTEPVSVPSQWHKMQPLILRYCKILLHIPPGG